MSWWSLVVYGLAAVWAVRTLLTLMVQHRRRHLAQLIAAQPTPSDAETKGLEESLGASEH
jgi:hypothetical protein